MTHSSTCSLRPGPQHYRHLAVGAVLSTTENRLSVTALREPRCCTSRTREGKSRVTLEHPVRQRERQHPGNNRATSKVPRWPGNASPGQTQNRTKTNDDNNRW